MSDLISEGLNQKVTISIVAFDCSSQVDWSFRRFAVVTRRPGLVGLTGGWPSGTGFRLCRIGFPPRLIGVTYASLPTLPPRCRLGFLKHLVYHVVIYLWIGFD